jgi:hypothetical protein
MDSFIFPGRWTGNDVRIRNAALLGAIAFLILFFWECKIYDLSSAMFTAFGLGLISRGKLDHYFAVFALASLNRETAFLLAIIFAVYCFGKIGRKGWFLSVGFQAYLFLAIRLCVAVIVAGNAGSIAWIRPLENLHLFIDAPVMAIVHWLAFAWLVWFYFRRWDFMPRMIKISFAVMMPALIALYLVSGYAFEIRAFVEAFPVVWWMVTSERGYRCDGGEKEIGDFRLEN